MGDVESVRQSIEAMLSGFAWGQIALTALSVLGTFVFVGESLEILLPKAMKEKLDEIENMTVVATILNVLRGFSYINPKKWNKEAPQAESKDSSQS